MSSTGWWSDKKKIEVVTTWLILGNVVLTAGTTGVPEDTVRKWKMQPWWNDLVIQIQTETDQELDSKLAKRIEKALELVNDRLENGDFMFNPKTGDFVRRPVSLKDGWKVASEMVDKRFILRKQPKESTSQEAIGDILKNLAKEFAEMAKKKVKERVEDGPVEIEAELQVGVQELPRDAGANQAPVDEKQSP